MGWDVDFLQQAVDTCTNDSGRIEDCKIFTLQAEDKQNQCKFEVPAEIAKEDTKGPMDSLPGNVAIKGPGDAPKGAASAGAAPSANNNDKPAANSPSIAGAVFAAKGSDSPAAAANTPPAANSPPPASTPPNPAPTPAPSAPPAGSNVQSIYSTEYRTQGNIVNEIVWIATEITVTQTQTRPTGQKHKHKRHMHKAHARSFQY
ncbi:hypothetical protein M7I_1880 [Glarea lozoyensis 74030]|uniref:Uncharacterized protein n=1 Tax=Glarea lozoyensis (strain ATCC 74030 / MF5533) TaxID=1104152 RepID=H0EHA3_GLAL7|nr:hypothetical protein M7I_1880 [Glarea lozoyensis 74030]